jgi:dihydroneopterin triphosphate diphosphatase
MQVRYDMVSVFIVRPDATGRSQEFLQLRRAPDDFMGNTWQTISGRPEDGEAAWQGALRELKEEAGLVPREFYRCGFISSFYISVQDTLWHATTFCAIIDRKDEVVLNEEHDAYRWIARESADEQFMWPTDRNVIQHICRDLLDNGPAKVHLRIPLPGGS